jgi:lysozyme
VEISQSGIDLIKRFEGAPNRTAEGEYKAYLDRIASPPIWTIYYGLTKGVHEGMIISEATGDRMFHKELAIYESGIEEAIGGVTLNQNQFDALVSFTYNCGVGAFTRGIAPLIRAKQFDRIPAKMKMYCHAGERRINGLVRRRAAEALLFVTPVEGDIDTFASPNNTDADEQGRMPQRVDEIKVPVGTTVVNTAKESTSFWSGIIGMITSIFVAFYQSIQGMLSAAGEVTHEVTVATESVSGFDALFTFIGVNMKLLLALIVVLCSVVVVFRSVKRRIDYPTPQ